jgi:uridine monophosphate synthetase
VEDVVVLIDRDQGGREFLAEHGLRLHALFSLGEMIDLLAQRGRISIPQRDKVRAFLSGSRSA